MDFDYSIIPVRLIIYSKVRMDLRPIVEMPSVTLETLRCHWLFESFTLLLYCGQFFQSNRFILFLCLQIILKFHFNRFYFFFKKFLCFEIIIECARRVQKFNFFVITTYTVWQFIYIIAFNVLIFRIHFNLKKNIEWLSVESMKFKSEFWKVFQKWTIVLKLALPDIFKKKFDFLPQMKPFCKISRYYWPNIFPKFERNNFQYCEVYFWKFQI